MFDIGASELLMIVIVAVVVIGPKDMPMALRTAGRWIGKMRRISGHFRSGIDTMVREAELEEMERKWREQNEAIMKAHPQLDTAQLDTAQLDTARLDTAQLDSAQPLTSAEMVPHPTSAEAALAKFEASEQLSEPERVAEPQLPLPPP